MINRTPAPPLLHNLTHTTPFLELGLTSTHLPGVRVGASRLGNQYRSRRVEPLGSCIMEKGEVVMVGSVKSPQPSNRRPSVPKP